MLQNDNGNMGLDKLTELLKEVYYNTNQKHVKLIAQRFFTGTQHHSFHKDYINFND